MSGIDLALGTYTINDIDLALPAAIPWVISRSYNARQKDSGGSYFASDGYQGKNWFQNSQPELVFHDSGTDSEDMIYLVYGADRYMEFRRGDATGSGDSTTTFRAVNGAAGAIFLHTFDDIDLATYYDQNGNRYDFFWFGDADVDDDIEGSLWRIMDPTIDVDPYDTGERLTSSDGNVAYVGDVGNPNTALSSYDATTGAVKTAYDSAGRKFTYTYPSSHLTEVKAEEGATLVGKVTYSYYEAADSHGEDDDLELVTITLPTTDSGNDSVRKKYYRYWEGTYDATNNPGYHHQLQYIIDFEGYRKYDWQDSDLNDTPLGASETNLKAYASAYFEYDTERRIVSAWFNGACGCSGAAAGTHTFEYETNGSYTDGSGYDTAWEARTVVQKPDATYEGDPIESWVTQYFDEVGQPLHRIATNKDPDSTEETLREWATKVTRDSSGLLTNIDTPGAVTAYTHSSTSFTVAPSDGLIRTVTRSSASDDADGFVSERKHRKGSTGTQYFDAYPDLELRTLVVGDFGITRPLVKETRVYTSASTTSATGYHATTYAYTYYDSTNTNVQYLVPDIVTITHPTVTSGNNGSNNPTDSKQYLRQDGSVAYAEAPDGIITYTRYTDGQLVKRIDDVATNGGYDASDNPSNWSLTLPTAGTASDRTTTYTYDDQGRPDTTTLPDGRVLKHYYSKLADGRLVTLSFTDSETSPFKVYGPVSYQVTNQAGRPEAQGTIALTGNSTTTTLTSHIDETDDDPITAIDVGTLARLSVNVHNETGFTVEESRAYFDVPASGDGTDGTHYDGTFFGYDAQGRRTRTKAPHGTISRTNYDTRGRVASQWIGTNDYAFEGGEAIGPDDMVKTVENEYDDDGEGNSYLTEQTRYVEGSTTDERVTSFTYDERGNRVLQENPTAPHIFSKYDNVGRVTASARYSSTASIDVSSDDPATETANRLTLSQMLYDQRGQVWKTQRHEIDDADGSDDDNLESLTWYDAAGRVIKQHGTQISKTFYDRLGRTTHQFTLANSNDSVYADADDVSGDIVLVARQTVYESTNSDEVVMSVIIERHHDDYGSGHTTGALDDNADGDELLVTATNLAGRAQITANWYDEFGRLTSTVRLGTNGDANYDRHDPPDTNDPPARSDTALRTDRAYNDDGSLQSITDPEDHETRYECYGACCMRRPTSR